MKRDELVFTSILTGFFAFMLFSALDLHQIKRFGEVGSGFWPILVLGAAFLLSAALLALSFHKYRKGQGQSPGGETAPGEGRPDPGGGRKKFILTVAFLLLYILVMPWAGFILSTLVYVLAFVFALGERRKSVLALSPALVTAIVVVVFVKFLSIPLPKGVGVFAQLSRLFY